MIPVWYRVLRGGGWLLACGAVAGGSAFLVARQRLPALPTSPSSTAWRAWPAPARISGDSWEALVRAVSAPTLEPAGSLARRFRLAGTFFLFQEGTEGAAEPARRAVLDDLQTREQRLVGIGDKLEGAEVIDIGHDRLVARVQGREEVLELSFAAGPGKPAQPVTTAASASPGGEAAALESNRFGDRVGETRWVFRRGALMDYYRELLDDPERLASVYLSLKPDYQDGHIAGYILDPEGEEEFFKTVGLQPGDIIRAVNSMPMTSRRRAEYFLGEFVQNRLNAVVLDVERGGSLQKLVYLIR